MLRRIFKIKHRQGKKINIQKIKDRRKDRVSNGRKGSHSFIDSVEQFKKKKSSKFQNIDESFLDKYKDFCMVYLGQKTRTIINQLIFIHILFNKAIKTGVVDSKYHPFGGEKEKIGIGSSHRTGLISNKT
jgi:hypothetical protein